MSALSFPALVYTTPRKLPKPESLAGRVAVLDIAFAADGMGTPFEKTTGRFIEALGSRLAAWVDHHDHELHAKFSADPRFRLATKAQHGACPEMVTPEVVAAAGPIDTLVTHVDLDGLYAAAKWILGGREPYPGADADARAVDTRLGTPGATAELIDNALRANPRDAALKNRIVRFLAGGLRDEEHLEVIREAGGAFVAMAAEARRLAEHFEPRGRAVFVDASQLARGAYDKTLLLLVGQERAPVAIVRDQGAIAVAAAFDSGIDFVAMMGLGGGMPTRVSLPDGRLDELLAKLNA